MLGGRGLHKMLRGGLRGSRYLEQLVDLTTDFLAHYGSLWLNAYRPVLLS